MEDIQAHLYAKTRFAILFYKFDQCLKRKKEKIYSNFHIKNRATKGGSSPLTSLINLLRHSLYTNISFQESWLLSYKKKVTDLKIMPTAFLHYFLPPYEKSYKFYLILSFFILILLYNSIKGIVRPWPRLSVFNA